MKKPLFKYTVNQQHLHNCSARITGILSCRDANSDAELKRLHYAYEEIKSRMSSDEIALMQAHENRVLTVAERAAEDKAIAMAMSENRDRSSI